MASICDICNDRVGDSLDGIKCYGLCRRTFHFTCISKSNPHYKKALLSTLSQIPNLKWFCNDCIVNSLIIANTAFHPITQSLSNCVTQITSLMSSAVSLKPVEPKSTPDLDTLTPGDQAQSQIDQQRDAMNQTMNTLENQNILDDNSDFRMETEDGSTGSGSLSSFVTVRGKKRKFSDVTLSPSKRQNTGETSPLDSLVFHPNVNASGSSNSNQDSASSDRLIYISPFEPQTKCEHIINHLKRHSFFDKIVNKTSCSRLVPENTSRKLTFVSFRLQVPNDYFHIFMDPKIWPANTTIKEFVKMTKPERPQISKSARNSKPNQNRRSNSHQARGGESKSRPDQKQRNLRQNQHSLSHRNLNQRNQNQRTPQKNWQDRVNQTPTRNRPHSDQDTPVGLIVENIIKRLMPIPMMYQPQMLNQPQIQNPMYPLNLMQRY